MTNRVKRDGSGTRTIEPEGLPIRGTEGPGIGVVRHNVPWPFDPAEPKPRPQTWRNHFKVFKRYWTPDRVTDAVRWGMVLAWGVFCASMGRGL